LIIKFFVGSFVGVGIALLAYRTHTLNRSGAIAAAILGTIIFGLAGAGWAAVMLTFFISSSGLSKIFRSRKTGIEKDFAKGSRRDAGQVAANGGVAGVLALLYFILQLTTPESRLLLILWIGFCASLGGANADTWATELGVLNPRQPVFVTTFKRVPRGTSGAISWLGTLAALAASTLVGGMAVLVYLGGGAPAGGLSLWLQFVLITAGGLTGSFVDSFLGATVQAVYHCPVCSKETERHPTHVCGIPTTLKRGWSWLNNDWVNTACTLSAGVAGMILAFIL
jgi:uncharacterized protein (TIGR00297 family)